MRVFLNIRSANVRFLSKRNANGRKAAVQGGKTPAFIYSIGISILNALHVFEYSYIRRRFLIFRGPAAYLP